MGLAVPLARRAAALRDLGESARDAHDVAVPAAARGAAIEALRRGETHYTDRPGILPLRERVADDLEQRFGLAVDARAGVVITCGVTEARFVAIQQLLPAADGTVVALAQPERVAGACLVRGVRLVGPHADVAGNVVVYVSGGADPGAREAWLARATEQRWPVLFEVDGPAPHPAAQGLAEQTVTIGGLGHDAGLEAWRVGFLAAPAATAGPLRDFKQALTICTTNLSQWGALGLMEATA
ncbi:MAG: hypothetical protein EA416_02125 [Trueperaceae bacterium]|nr:MAG: hypothetical protein EA416_02125 [Trueperaceae bacterium]